MFSGNMTEKNNPNTAGLDQMSTASVLARLNNEDQRVAIAVARALPAVEKAVEGIVARLRHGGRLFYVGAGTSGRLGVLDAVECVPTFRTPPEMVQALIAGGEVALTRAVEGAEDDRDGARAELEARQLGADDALVGIAASGHTPYTLGAVALAREQGALTIGIACNEPAPLLEESEIAIAAIVGPEALAGSTRLKAGTAQKLILNMLSTATMVRLGKVYGNRMVDLQITNAKLARRARALTMEILEIDETSAAELLERAGNHVKTAIVMGRLGVDQCEAGQRLEAADGFLWRTLATE